MPRDVGRFPGRPDTWSGNRKGADHIGIASAYRSFEREQELWNGYFLNYYIQTIEHREKLPGGPLGEAAIDFMAGYVGKRKAAPGHSNHSLGLAVDFKFRGEGKTLGPNFSDIDGWRKSRLFGWLGDPKTGAAAYGFRPYVAEPWHWDYRP